MLHKNSAFYIKKKKVFNKANMKKKRNMLSLLVKQDVKPIKTITFFYIIDDIQQDFHWKTYNSYSFLYVSLSFFHQIL